MSTLPSRSLELALPTPGTHGGQASQSDWHYSFTLPAPQGRPSRFKSHRKGAAVRQNRLRLVVFLRSSDTFRHIAPSTKTEESILGISNLTVLSFPSSHLSSHRQRRWTPVPLLPPARRPRQAAPSPFRRHTDLRSPSGQARSKRKEAQRSLLPVQQRPSATSEPSS